MSRIWLLFLFCLSLVLVVVPLSRASLTLRVNESSTRVLFDEPATRVVLAVENPLGRRVDGHIKLELIDTNGVVRATANRDQQIKPGASTVVIPIAIWLSGKTTTGTRELLWYRLRYQVTPASSAQFDPVGGVISLSEITPDIFALHVAAPSKAQEGSGYRLRLRTAQPRTGHPVPGVLIKAEITFDGDDRADVVLKQSTRTNENGFATLDFQIPRDLEDDEGEIEIVARRGILTETAESDLELDRYAHVLVNTDKPLYQPGQTLHTRVLMFDSSRQALAGQEATLKISDPQGTTVFQTDLTASRFGVASADWQVPENTRLGDYAVEVDLEGDKYYNSQGAAFAKISRYDLPNFSVNVKPDRPYYLANQNAAVEVSGDYLFGQPVKRGHVRVVRESERHWNYREQKWEREEGDKYEGETGADGRFVAHINLSAEHDELIEEDYSRYRDLSYAAYFTDPTTNRTEERRFDLRLTKDAIHIYVIERTSKHTQHFPLEFYVSTSYADGTAASCEISISQLREDDDQAETALRTIRTSKYGLAKVTGLTLPNQSEDSGSQVELMLRARDLKGMTGKHADSISLQDKPAIQVETDKPLYRDGDAIHATIVASQPDLALTADLIGEKKVLQSQVVLLQNGKASLTFPYRPTFVGPLTLAVYAPDPDDEDEVIGGTRTVMYPHDRDLKLQLALNQESYRPGEEASASFLTRSASGQAAQSALGIVIFDKAVEERARTDRDTKGRYGFYSSYCSLTACSGNIGGVTRKDLEQLDLTKPLPEGLELVAEVLLTDYRFMPRFFHSQRFESEASRAFSDSIKNQIDPLKARLESEYDKHCVYPTDPAALQRLAATAGVAMEKLRDPWETLYRPEFFAADISDVFQLTSAGADKRFDTEDDFTVLRLTRPYFRFTGEAINRAVVRYHARTGEFILEARALKNELYREGIDFDLLRDPWDQPYQVEFGVNQTKFLLSVLSSGPDKQFSNRTNDDVLLWTSSIDYAQDVQTKVDSALATYLNANSQIPQTDPELNAALKSSALNRSDLRDPWGRPYYATFKQRAIYGNRVTVFQVASYGEKAKDRTELTPVTQHVNQIYLRSDGEDGKEGTADDFDVASFSQLTTEQAGNKVEQSPATPKIILPGSTGAITGTVTDTTGAVVAGASVTAKNLRTLTEYTVTSGENGVYLIKNLAAGSYEVTFDAPGFKRAVITNVPVRSSSLTTVDLMAEPGAISETVNVMAAAEETLNTSSASTTALSITQRSVSMLVKLAPGGVAEKRPLSTPRLREYFPETLVWQPALETNKHGRAQLKFKLADNITTWKMSVIGSTADGQIGTVEREIRSFQPFFVEHDPPRVLTEGDEISLPVVVRNYLDQAQIVGLTIKPETWFTLLDPATKNAEVAAGDAVRATFDLRVTASVKDGKQRITASGADANDAIEKPVSVHPDGEERTTSDSDIIADNGTLTLAIPSDLVANSARAELKIYPNLMAHVAESVEAIMSRPYGCGEQTISSTYPSLLLLRNYKRTGQDSPLRAKANHYLHDGYARLLNYRSESGGFTYWGRGEPDLALTAYALRFLSDARELTTVDDDVINQARTWLLKQQRNDGSWVVYDYGNNVENKQRTASLTAYLARVLAMTEPKDRPAQGQVSGTASVNQPAKKPSDAALGLRRALDYLSLRVDEIDEPYLIASYVLAALDAGESERARKSVAKLRALAHETNGASYWALEINTPFYGWGLAGRIETTALVVQALSRYCGSPGSDCGSTIEPKIANQQLVNRGLLFLLREKDRYGVWYSTQATINVLDTLLAVLAQQQSPLPPGHSITAEILVNGRSARSVELPSAARSVNPISVDLSAFLQTGTNRIEVRRPSGGSPASAQAVASYYVPWARSGASPDADSRSHGASALRLVTKFDKTTGRISDEINCHVEAERIGHSGYGMLLAEIGLPPGADVDRASLERAMKESNWAINQYDILPDRVIVYLWPRAGGVKFDFKFRPRMGLNAQTAPATVYDYYNPEARAVVPPARFVIK